MAKTNPASRQQVAGLGFPLSGVAHGFAIVVPSGTAADHFVQVSEHRGTTPDWLTSGTLPVQSPSAPELRVLITRGRWLALAPTFWDDANRRLRANGLPTRRFVKAPSQPVPVHPSLGKELCVLCWAVEDAAMDDIPNALMNWEALAPEERWWLYTMTVATTGQALQKGIGWRKALRAALADNPFIKGEGLSPRARRELLNHSQISLAL